MSATLRLPLLPPGGKKKPAAARLTEIILHDATVSRDETIPELVRKIIIRLGEDPNREGLRKTPERYEKALQFLTSGYNQTVDRVLNGATFSVHYDHMVVVQDIEFFSLCEHHMLPFFGRAHVAYLPSKRVLGLSKIARLVNMFARRLQIQERMTYQVAKSIEDKISPQGVGVIIEARHLCMQMRGVEKQHGKAVTCVLLGSFRRNRHIRDQFVSLVRPKRS